ncbi:hypothetical protein DIZ81_03185 [Legionella taurinensis]|uniref:Coiled-coil protein n=1 Tax=Legionella taurinensis TaxID=70611 RepID=A0A3A5L4H6_9GAMM|nr:hypothetical protein [Legionella taurinensis]MDX1836121.1 hypothetical protein [Legionella taurinensis]PUT42105.1 hypothetical protein DB744_03190 [Legionella taurinensis]PUT44892.1 hypothetical protein DB746_03190 [Legionella taurinensis]PUT48213.1 hypothetical protein DB743_01350 [Legionella taurinensis]PUT49027.1 hypothetical protein DB745_03190 [Legionella taurinensis]
MSAKSNELLLTPQALLSQSGIAAAGDFYKFRTQVNLLTREELEKLQDYVPALLPFYLTELATINSASFKYLNKTQKKVQLDKLRLIYFLLYAQYQLDSVQGRQYKLRGYKESMDVCAGFIDHLTTLSETKNDPLEQQHQVEQGYSEKYLKFSGRLVGYWLAERLQELYGLKDIEEDLDSNKVNELQENKKQKYKADREAFAALEGIEAEKVEQGEFRSGVTAYIKKQMRAINERRLYWVWGGGMLASVLDLLSDDFFNKQQTQAAVSYPSPFTGYMSWLLYYARFALNMTLVLKHTFVGPWMTKEEKEAAKFSTPWQRFTGELKERKYALLNDSIWATANLVCFFWLKGPGVLGWGGNIATAALLAMDLVLTVIRYFEEEADHKKHIIMLNEAIIQLQLAPGNEARIKELEKAIVQAEFDWKYKKYGTLTDIAYAAGLMVVFTAFFCCVAFPGLVAAPTLMILSAVGAALCFALTVAYSAVSSGIEIAKTKGTAEQIKKQYNESFEEFNRLKKDYDEKSAHLLDVDDKELDELCNNLRVHYLVLRDLEADVDYQNRTARFQSVKLVHSIFVDACIPTLIFASFTFMPLPIAIAVLAAGLLLAGLSYLLINQFKPEPSEKAVLGDQDKDFWSFLEEPVNPFNKPKTANARGFFSHPEAVEDEKAPLIDAGSESKPDPDSPAPDLLTF